MSAARQPVLEVRDVDVSVPRRLLVRAASLDVCPGEMWALIGPNGAGKTLLLNTIVGLRRIECGSVRLAARSLDQMQPAEAARIRGFVPQSAHHPFSTRVVDIVMMGRYPHLPGWRWEGDDDVRRALEALRQVEMGHAADRDILTLSGGEQQRVCIAALLAQDVALLILDEPVSHLDLHHQLQILSHLRSLAEAGRSVIVSIHDLNLAYRFATHAMLLRGDGRSTYGTVHDVMQERELSEAFHCTLQRTAANGRTLFVPA